MIGHAGEGPGRVLGVALAEVGAGALPRVDRGDDALGHARGERQADRGAADRGDVAEGIGGDAALGLVVEAHGLGVIAGDVRDGDRHRRLPRDEDEVVRVERLRLLEVRPDARDVVDRVRADVLLEGDGHPELTAPEEDVAARHRQRRVARRVRVEHVAVHLVDRDPQIATGLERDPEARLRAGVGVGLGEPATVLEGGRIDPAAAEAAGEGEEHEEQRGRAARHQNGRLVLRTMS